jgi:hypothetical protein
LPTAFAFAIMAGSLVLARPFTLLALAAAASVWASATPAGVSLSRSADPPWTDPTHQGEFELLAGRIASSLAGRTVAVHCESPSSWQTLSGQLGFDPELELGYVPVSFDPTGGTVLGDPTLVELSPDVCLRLQQFAHANPKPTTCTVVTTRRETVWVKRRVLVRKQTADKGKVHTRFVWQTKLERTTLTKRVRSAPRPCFAKGAPVAGMTNAYWLRYADDASAILVLAHETVHLTQYRAGLLAPSSNAAESEAQCVGLQRMPAIAAGLGDTAADGEAIAQFAYADIYPNFKGTPYWSADCVPGGMLDRRAVGHRVWP